MPEIFSGIFYMYRVNGKALFSEIIGEERELFLEAGGEIAFPENKEKECYPAGKKAHADFFVHCL